MLWASMSTIKKSKDMQRGGAKRNNTASVGNFSPGILRQLVVWLAPHLQGMWRRDKRRASLVSMIF